METRSREYETFIGMDLRLVGVSLWIAWITLIYSGDFTIAVPGSSQEWVSSSFLMSTASLGVSLFVSSLIPRQISQKLFTKVAGVILAVIGAAATSCVFAAQWIPLPLFVLSAILTGVVTSFIALKAAMIFSESETQQMLISMCWALILRLLVYAFITLIDGYGYNVFATVLVVALIPLSYLFLYSDRRSHGEEDLADLTELHVPVSFVRLLFYVGLLMLVLSIVRGYYPRFIDGTEFALSRGVIMVGLFAVTIGIAIIIAKMPRSASFGTFCYVFLSLSVVIVPVLTLCGVDYVAIGNISAVLFGTTMLCGWGILCRVPFRTGLSPITAVGMGFGSMCFGATAGFAIGAFIYDWNYSNGILMSISVLSLVVCAVAAIFLLRRKDIVSLMQPSLEEVREAENLDVPGFGNSEAWGSENRGVRDSKGSGVRGRGNPQEQGFDNPGVRRWGNPDARASENPGVLSSGNPEVRGWGNQQAQSLGAWNLDAGTRSTLNSDDEAGERGLEDTFALTGSGFAERMLASDVQPMDYRESLQYLCSHMAIDYNLSPRECDVLTKLAAGRDAKTIAEELFISFNTVRTHIRKIYAKLEIHNRQELSKLVDRYAEKARKQNE